MISSDFKRFIKWSYNLHKLYNSYNKTNISKIKPMHRKSFLTEASNCRPISLWSLISKVIEKFIQDQTRAFLLFRNLLYNYQSGFCKNHSTNYCLSFLNNKILKISDQGLMTGMILIDLQKNLWYNWLWHSIAMYCMLLVSLNIR